MDVRTTRVPFNVGNVGNVGNLGNGQRRTLNGTTVSACSSPLCASKTSAKSPGAIDASGKSSCQPADDPLIASGSSVAPRRSIRRPVSVTGPAVLP
jgi:hypothetical protein